MKATFLVDFRGVETSEAYYRAGEKGNINAEFYDDLVKRGIVEGKKEAVKDIEKEPVKRTKKK